MQNDNGLKFASEIIEIASRDPLLSTDFHATQDEIVINDFDHAVELAGSPMWEHIRHSKAGEIRRQLDSNNQYTEIEDELQTLYRKIAQSLNIWDKVLDVADDICEDFWACVKGRIAWPDSGHPFYERLLSIYKKGGWPCGWEGDYPEGKAVVYVPSVMEPLDLSEVYQLVSKGKRVLAIKKYMELTGRNFDTAKDYINSVS